MEKISSEQVVELLSDASATIRAQAEELSVLRDKVASDDLRRRVEKVASAMHAKSLRLDIPFTDLCEELAKEAAAGRLETVESAVEMVGPDMGKFARVRDTNNDQGNESSGSEAAFTQFILQ